MKRLGHIRELALSVILPVIFASLPTSGAAQSGPPLGLNVTVTNTTSNPVPVTGIVSVGNSLTGSVSITGTPSVNIANSPTVVVGNLPKPSQLVTVSVTFPVSLNCDSDFGALVNRLQNADGTKAFLNIPIGQVLIATDAELSLVFPGTPGDQELLSLVRISSDGANTNVVVRDSVSIDSGGNASKAFNFPAGAVVKPGVSLCVEAFDVTTSTVVFPVATIHGYLANDE